VGCWCGCATAQSLIWQTSLSGRLLLIFPVLAGLFDLTVMLWLSGAFEPQAFPDIPAYEEPSAGEAFGTVVFAGAIGMYNLLPAAALAVLISLTSRRFAWSPCFGVRPARRYAHKA